jgi:DNA repair protein RecO (recombination protein O)
VRIPKPPGQLDLLIESELLEDYASLRRDYGRFAAACYLLDVVETLTVEEAPDRGLYEQLEAALGALAAEAPLEPTVLRFEARALRLLGFFPRLARCGACQKPVGEEAWFSCLDGGAVCIGCRPRDPGRQKVRRAVLEALGALTGPEPAEPPPAELRPLMNRYLAFLAERRLRTWASYPRV